MTSVSEAFKDSLFEHIAAGFSGIWITSSEHEEACDDIQTMCRENDMAYYQWDCIEGLGQVIVNERSNPEIRRVAFGENTEYEGFENQSPYIALPIDPATNRLQTNLEDVIQRLDAITADERGSRLKVNEDERMYGVLVIKNIQAFVGSVGMQQLLSNKLWLARSQQQVVIGLSHTAQIPVELEKQFQVIDHPLPDRERLLAIAQGIASEDTDIPQDEEAKEKIIDAAAGLTHAEAEGAFALSLARHGSIQADSVFELKANMLRKNTGALSIYQGGEKFSDIGGFSFPKEFCLDTLARREPNPRFRAKGILLTGLSGGGKSLFAKALGNEVERPTLICDIGALLGRYVGQSEENMRKMLRTADAMSPCILMIDEVEKALAGVGSSGANDSGVKAGIFGQLLTWMNDHTSDVYMIVTCNDITKLTSDNPEFARQGRFDGMFFVDFPGQEARDQIWSIHLQNYGFLEPGQDLSSFDQEIPQLAEITGAEIEGICRLARLRNKPLSRIAETMPRLTHQAADVIKKSRDWAANRCWSTEAEELYDPAKVSGNKSRIAKAGARKTSRQRSNFRASDN